MTAPPSPLPGGEQVSLDQVVGYLRFKLGRGCLSLFLSDTIINENRFC